MFIYFVTFLNKKRLIIYKPIIKIMKTFNRTYLPETIEYNKRVYVHNASLTSLLMQSITLADYCKTLESAGNKIVLCNVLSKNLRNKTNLHGQPYKPTQWVFICKE